MKKARLIAPRNVCRELPSGPDADRLLDSGSWVLAYQPVKKRRASLPKRNWYRQRVAAGYKQVQLMLSPELHAQLHALKRQGETLHKLMQRLVKTQYEVDEKSKSQVHK